MSGCQTTLPTCWDKNGGPEPQGDCVSGVPLGAWSEANEASQKVTF